MFYFCVLFLKLDISVESFLDITFEKPTQPALQFVPFEIWDGAGFKETFWLVLEKFWDIPIGYLRPHCQLFCRLRWTIQARVHFTICAETSGLITGQWMLRMLHAWTPFCTKLLACQPDIKCVTQIKTLYTWTKQKKQHLTKKRKTKWLSHYYHQQTKCLTPLEPLSNTTKWKKGACCSTETI